MAQQNGIGKAGMQHWRGSAGHRPKVHNKRPENKNADRAQGAVGVFE